LGRVFLSNGFWLQRLKWLAFPQYCLDFRQDHQEETLLSAKVIVLAQSIFGSGILLHMDKCTWKQPRFLIEITKNGWSHFFTAL